MNDENETKGKPEGIADKKTEGLQRDAAAKVMEPLGENVRIAIVLDIKEDKDDGATVEGSSYVMFDGAAATTYTVASGKSLMHALQMVARGFNGPSKDELAGWIVRKSGDAIRAAIKNIAGLAEPEAKDDEADAPTDAAEPAEEVTK